MVKRIEIYQVIKSDKNDSSSIEGNAVGAVNNTLHSIFRSSSVYLNNFNYGSDASENHLASQGNFPNFGRITTGKYVYPDSNETLKNMFQNSNKVELFGKVHGDIFNQTKLLVHNQH